MEWVLISFIAIAGTCIGVSHHHDTVKKEAAMQSQIKALTIEKNKEAAELVNATKPKPKPKQADVIVRDLS